MEDQGIMALPQAGMQAPTTAPTQYPMGEAAIAAFDQARSQMNPKEFGDDLLSTAEQVDPAAVREFRTALQSFNLPPEIIDALNQLVDTILAEPEKYAEIRANFIAEGVPEDFLPAQFDATFFGALNLALDQMTGASMPMTSQQFAQGGIVSLKPIAKMLAAQGRNGDTMLAHITPTEARILRRRGGSGTINPVTGLPEFFLGKIFKAVGKAFKAVGKAVSSVVKGVANAIKKFASSTIGKIVTTVALGFFLGPAAASMLGVSSAAGVAAVSGFVGSAGSTLLGGGSIKDALKAGVVGGLTAGAGTVATSGLDAFAAGSYAGPTTVAGQVENFTNSLKSLTGAPTSAAGTAGTTAEQLGASVNSIEDAVGKPFLSTPEAVAPGIIEDAVGKPFLSTPEAVAPGIPVAQPAAVPTPDFVATAPGAGTQMAGTATGIGQVPGTPIQLNPFEQAFQNQGFNEAISVGETVPFASSPSNAAIERSALGMTGPVDTARQALSSPLDVGTDIYNRYFDPSRGTLSQDQLFSKAQQLQQQAGTSTQLDVYGRPQQVSNLSFKDAYAIAEKSQPGVFARYAPIVAAGTGLAAAAGAFTPEEPKAPGIVPRTTGFDLYNQNPAEYGVTPGGASTTFAPPSITPGYGVTTYAGEPSGYGMMGNQFAAPQFRVRDPREYLTPYGIAALAPRQFNMGGFAKGGIGALNRKYPRRTGPISGPGTETSDSIPAMLSDGEFVMTARAVRGAGGGSRREGAKRMYQMMRKFERKA